MWIFKRYPVCEAAGDDGGNGGGGDGGGGPQLPPLESVIPEDLKGDSAFEGVADLPSLVKSYVNAQRMIGKDKVALPGENATEEELNEFYSKLGRPESPDKYGFKPPEELPEGYSVQEELVKEFSEQAHKHGLTTAQAKHLFDWFVGKQASEYQAFNEHLSTSQQEAVDSLKQEWGRAFDERVGLAKQAVAKFGGDELKTYLDESGLGNHPSLIKAFAEVGKLLKEDGAPPGSGSTSFTMSAEEARMEIAQLQANKEFMQQYNNDMNPGHKEAVERMQKLFKHAYPSDEPVAVVGTGGRG